MASELIIKCFDYAKTQVNNLTKNIKFNFTDKYFLKVKNKDTRQRSWNLF